MEDGLLSMEDNIDSELELELELLLGGAALSCSCWVVCSEVVRSSSLSVELILLL